MWEEIRICGACLDDKDIRQEMKTLIKVCQEILRKIQSLKEDHR